MFSNSTAETSKPSISEKGFVVIKGLYYNKSTTMRSMNKLYFLVLLEFYADFNIISVISWVNKHLLG